MVAIAVRPGCWSFHAGRYLRICKFSPFCPLSHSRLYFVGGVPVELSRSCGGDVDIHTQSCGWEYLLVVFR